MKCPNCDKDVEWQDNPFRPFCSERCKMVDLGKWVNDEYRVPGKSLPSDPSESESNESDDHVRSER